MRGCTMTDGEQQQRTQQRRKLAAKLRTDRAPSARGREREREREREGERERGGKERENVKLETLLETLSINQPYSSTNVSMLTLARVRLFTASNLGGGVRWTPQPFGP